MIWSPAPADLQRCGDGTTSADAAKSTPAAKTAAAEPAPAPSTPAPAVTQVKPTIVNKTPEVAAQPAPAPSKTVETETPVTPATETANDDVATAPAGTSDTAPAEADAVEEDIASDDGEETGDKIGGLLDRLAELERETGYGLKKTGNGKCRLKVPFATVDIPCDK